MAQKTRGKKEKKVGRTGARTKACWARLESFRKSEKKGTEKTRKIANVEGTRLDSRKIRWSHNKNWTN